MNEKIHRINSNVEEKTKTKTEKQRDDQMKTEQMFFCLDIK